VVVVVAEEEVVVEVIPANHIGVEELAAVLGNLTLLIEEDIPLKAPTYLPLDLQTEYPKTFLDSYLNHPHHLLVLLSNKFHLCNQYISQYLK